MFGRENGTFGDDAAGHDVDHAGFEFGFVDAEARGGVALRVKVNNEGAVFVFGEIIAKIDGSGSFADTSFLIRNADYDSHIRYCSTILFFRQKLFEFLAGVRGEDFLEPGFFGGLVFAGEDFYDVALFEAVIEIAHFAVDFNADDVAADFAVETEGEVEGERAGGEVDDVAFGGVDEDFIGEEVEAEFSHVNFFAFFEASGSFLELGNPEEVGGEVFDFALFVVFGEFLLVIIEAGGETAFSVFVHFASTDLELDDFFVFGDDGGVEGLVAVLLRFGDVIFDAAVHGGVEGVEEAEGEIAAGDVGDDDAERGEVVNLAHVLVVFGEFFVEGVDGFDAAGNLEVDFFFFEEVGDFLFDLFEGAGALFVGFGDEVFEIFVTFGVDVGEGEVGELDAEAAHVETVGERGEDF